MELEELHEGIFQRLREIEAKVDRVLEGESKLQGDVTYIREQLFPNELGVLYGTPRKTP
jgi:hypothetical protein